MKQANLFQILKKSKAIAVFFGVSLDELVSCKKVENAGLGIPPKGKYVFGLVKVGEKGQIVLPAKARKVFDINPGDNLLVLGDENSGIAIIKEKSLLSLLDAARSGTA